ncbi:hypothetical protein AJ79_04360 [Helicocarpus griseus UAMH5409]|uniref:Response regulatory domain-containing protein n=1 Tax=Helicocarpus griseus UAMH5409 TaxID=1447875 RepID=A0A2B7XKM0_9EURO|nr:hypothetical protein AJ79_04360 [Helicocarpus griseus UAMH5409]
MPMDREHRLSRLTAKLLRRRSSSSSANFVVPNSPNPSTTTTTTTATTAAVNVNASSTPPATKNTSAAITPPPSAPIVHDHDQHRFQLQLEPHPPPSSASPFSPPPSSSLTSPAYDNSDLLSPLTAIRLQSGDEAPASSNQADHQLQLQNRHPDHAADSQAQLTQEPEEDAEIAEHTDQFPAISFPNPAGLEPDLETGSSTRSSLSISRAPDAKEDRLPHRLLEDYSLSRASSTKDKSSYFRSPRNPLPRSSATSTPSLNVVGESRQSNTPLSASTSAKATPSSKPVRPSIAVRRQSLVPSSQQRLIRTLLEPSSSASGDYFSGSLPSIHRDMVSRKIWVKRPNSSPTLVAVTEEDLVDDLRDVILKKYGNSLGRTFDSPDIIIKLFPREPSSRPGSQERVLGPEEPVGRTLDTFYPGGQTVDEALVIEVPQRRTPKPSPRQQNLGYCHPEDLRPGETGEYFPPMAMIHTPNASGSASNASVPSSHHAPPVHSMSVITTGQLPPVPSPGSRGSWHQHQHRPKYGRQHTSSPTVVSTSPNPNIADSNSAAPLNGMPPVPAPPSMSTPPAPSPEQPKQAVPSPPARSASPRPPGKQRKSKKGSNNNPPPNNLLDGTVPPINVLIVEDNIINLKLLEAFMKRLKVRWSTAMNGREAVNKWRAGGFHLVLMDIQLPVMSGLEATKEIRRCERLNNIGVFSRTVSGQSKGSRSSVTSPLGGPEEQIPETLKPEDKLENPEAFKSPVIIVALTASSLQSDRNEALAAGCNDFLTKPVNILWLEQKVTEWGCMQALIDFEGWRKWRKFDEQQAQQPPEPTTTSSEPSENRKPEALAQRRKSQPNILESGSGKNDVAGSRDGAASPASSKYGSTSGKESSGNGPSSTAAANGSSKLDASSPGARSATGTSSSGRRANRNSGGSTPKTPRA